MCPNISFCLFTLDIPSCCMDSDAIETEKNTKSWSSRGNTLTGFEGFLKICGYLCVHTHWICIGFSNTLSKGKSKFIKSKRRRNINQLDNNHVLYEIQREEHKSFLWSFAKLFLMMCGDIDFEEMLSKESVEDPRTNAPRLMLYFFFVILVTIILFNLLIAMTVNNTKVSYECITFKSVYRLHLTIFA